jgi:hypothetical protein
MNTIFEELVNKGQEPTREDIGKLLASIAEPRLERDEKQLIVRKLYEELGYSGQNSQGFHHAEDLEDYGEF